jgi:GNAT superfamily N-acetyltransferase
MADVTDTVAPTPVMSRPGQSYQAAHLRWASIADAPRLAALWRIAYPDDATSTPEMAAWLEHGGALTLQDPSGTILAAMRWRVEGSGWRVDRVATRPDERGQGYGRWLATRVEALAIRHSVPHLSLDLPGADREQEAYYRRMGYHVVEGDASPRRTLRKVVGGVWQTKSTGSRPA